MTTGAEMGTCWPQTSFRLDPEDRVNLLQKFQQTIGIRAFARIHYGDFIRLGRNTVQSGG